MAGPAGDEHDNLAATMSWLVDQDQIERAVTLGWETWRYWWLHGHAGELHHIMEKLVAKTERLPTYQRALALSAAGFEFSADGEPARARLLDVGVVCNFLGQIRLSQGDVDGAARFFTDGLSAARSARDRFTILISLYDLALSSQALGDLTSAARRLKEGLSLSAEAGDGPSAAYYLEAAGLRATRLAGRRCGGDVARADGRCRIRAGLGVGRGPRRQPRRAVRTGRSAT